LIEAQEKFAADCTSNRSADKLRHLRNPETLSGWGSWD